MRRSLSGSQTSLAGVVRPCFPSRSGSIRAVALPRLPTQAPPLRARLRHLSCEIPGGQRSPFPRSQACPGPGNNDRLPPLRGENAAMFILWLNAPSIHSRRGSSSRGGSPSAAPSGSNRSYISMRRSRCGRPTAPIRISPWFCMKTPVRKTKLCGKPTPIPARLERPPYSNERISQLLDNFFTYSHRRTAALQTELTPEFPGEAELLRGVTRTPSNSRNGFRRDCARARRLSSGSRSQHERSPLEALEEQKQNGNDNA